MTRQRRSEVLVCLLFASALAVPARGAGDVTLECTAEIYVQGDSVFCTWTNGTEETIVAGSHPPYDIYDALTGEIVEIVGLPWEYHLGPGETAELSWDQRDVEGNLAPPGQYILRISYVFGQPPPSFHVEDRFRILAPADAPGEDPRVQSATWGRVRGRYR